MERSMSRTPIRNRLLSHSSYPHKVASTNGNFRLVYVAVHVLNPEDPESLERLWSDKPVSVGALR